MPASITHFSFGEGRRLILYFEDGSSFERDFSFEIGMGGVFTRLKDESYWRLGQILDQGRALGWPGNPDEPLSELDFCADALWFEAHPAEYQEYLAKTEHASIRR